MFAHAASFNQPLDKWDVSSVEDMSCMFQNAASLNQPLDKWVVADGTDVRYMFGCAASFDQPATLKRFGLVPPSPSRAHTHTHARRPTASSASTVSPCAHLQRTRTHCSAGLHARVHRAGRTHSSARANCIHAQPMCTGQAEARA